MSLKSLILLFVSFIHFQIFAQKNGNVTGIITDATTKENISFATIKVINAIDNKLITGTLSDDKGNFKISLDYGTYIIEIESISYSKYKSEQVTLNQNIKSVDLGKFELKTSSKNLEALVVQAEKSSMEFNLDKKVFNVGKDLANSGGSASDILTNIPSVSVDPEGGIKLRGSDNVRILIDGKPSGLVSFKGGAGLQSLPANMIERVEIITNPSAKYEAEGMSGIINVILKKDKKQGFNGSIDLISGNPTNFGLGLNMNYRHKKVNLFVNYGLAYRKSPNIASIYQEVYKTDLILITEQSRNGTLAGLNNNIRGGIDYYFSEKSILTGSYLFRRSDAHRITYLDYYDYLNNLNNKIGQTFRKQDETEDEPNSEYALSYKKDFNKKNHTFSSEIRFLDNWERSDQLFTQNSFLENNSINKPQTYIQTSLNDEFEKQWLFQTDYSQPLGKEGKFETGIRSSFRNMVNDFVVNQLNDSGIPVVIPNLKNYFTYKENIQAFYGILANKNKKISYQAGLRMEFSNVITSLRDTKETYPRKYKNLFPSAHLSYSISDENALQISYSKRIRRPFYNDLSPFMTFADSRNFVAGNPNLNPECTDSYEIGHIRYFKNGSISSSLYFRNSQDKIQAIRSVDSNGFASTLPQNLKGENSFGIELAGQASITKWWKFDMNLNFFKAKIDGSNIDKEYIRETYSWSARQSSRFSLPKKIDIQVRGNFEAYQKMVQGYRLPLYFIDFSIAKEILKGKGNLNLNVLDLFNTRKIRTNINEVSFYTNAMSQFRRRQANLTLNYRINNGKKVKSLIGEDN
jgi:ferric enterobactin receptor